MTVLKAVNFQSMNLSKHFEIGIITTQFTYEVTNLTMVISRKILSDIKILKFPHCEYVGSLTSLCKYK